MLVGDDPLPCRGGVGEEEAVPSRQQARRRLDGWVGTRCVAKVVQLATIVTTERHDPVAEREDRVAPAPRAAAPSDVGHQVLDAGRPEGGKVALGHLSRGRCLVQVRGGRANPILRRRVARSAISLALEWHVHQRDRCREVSPVHAVRRIGGRWRSRLHDRVHVTDPERPIAQRVAHCRMGRAEAAPEGGVVDIGLEDGAKLRPPEILREQRDRPEVLGRHHVDGDPHERGADDAAILQRGGQGGGCATSRADQQRHGRPLRMLGLERSKSCHRVRRRTFGERCQQPLARERGAVEGTPGEPRLGHSARGSGQASLRMTPMTLPWICTSVA